MTKNFQKIIQIYILITFLPYLAAFEDAPDRQVQQRVLLLSAKEEYLKYFSDRVGRVDVIDSTQVAIISKNGFSGVPRALSGAFCTFLHDKIETDLPHADVMIKVFRGSKNKPWLEDKCRQFKTYQ